MSCQGYLAVGVGVKESSPLASPDDACTPVSHVQTPYGVALFKIHESHGCSKLLPGELIWGASANEVRLKSARVRWNGHIHDIHSGCYGRPESPPLNL